MTSMIDSDLHVTTPPALSRRWWAFSFIDQCFVAVMGMITFTVLVVYGSPEFLVPLVLTLGALERADEGRLYYVALQGIKTLWIRFWRKGVLWSSPESENSDMASHRRTNRRTLSRSDEGPIPLAVHAIGDIGLVHNRRKKMDSIILVGDGSDISTLDLTGQANRHSQMVRILKRVATIPGITLGVSYVFRRRPSDPISNLEWGVQNLHPSVLLPEGLTKAKEESLTIQEQRDMRLNLNVMERMRMDQQYGSQVTMAVLLSVRRTGGILSAKSGKSVAEDDIKRLDIVQMAELAVEGLTNSGVKGARVLNPSEVKQYLRGAWDVATLDDYRPSDDDEDDRHWPQQMIKVSNDHSVFDTTGHEVIRINGMPEAQLPHYMRQLHGLGVKYASYTLVSDTVKSKGEYFLLGQFMGITDNIREALGRERTVDRPHIRSRREALESRQEELFRSVFSQMYAILIVISAESPHELESQVHTALRQAESLGFPGKVIKGECRQQDALWSGSGFDML